jgi:hypothetical protein
MEPLRTPPIQGPDVPDTPPQRSSQFAHFVHNTKSLKEQAPGVVARHHYMAYNRKLLNNLLEFLISFQPENESLFHTIVFNVKLSEISEFLDKNQDTDTNSSKLNKLDTFVFPFGAYGVQSGIATWAAVAAAPHAVAGSAITASIGATGGLPALVGAWAAYKAMKRSKRNKRVKEMEELEKKMNKFRPVDDNAMGGPSNQMFREELVKVFETMNTPLTDNMEAKRLGIPSDGGQPYSRGGPYDIAKENFTNEYDTFEANLTKHIDYLTGTDVVLPDTTTPPRHAVAPDSAAGLAGPGAGARETVFTIGDAE